MGTDAWRNWRANLKADASLRGRYEDALYSDAWFVGGKLELGPFVLIATLAEGVPMPLALVLRCDVCTSLGRELIDQKTNKLLPSDSTSYHGGTMSDEIAALVSLAFGVRCRAGGTTRMWGLYNNDPAGTPIEYNRQHLARPGPPQKELLPNTVREVNFADGAGRLRSFPRLSSKNAINLIRAARLYSNALWWANEDPNFAWLQLVGAIETVAGDTTGETSRTPAEKLAESRPDLWEALKDAPESTIEKVSKILQSQAPVTRKFKNFIQDFGPAAPKMRPEIGQLEWPQMRRHMDMIYKHRSKSLHAGTPYPQPMLEKPYKGTDGLPSEIPLGGSAASNGSSWKAKEMPMMLHTFEYIVRASLLNWWDSLLIAEDDSSTENPF